MTHTPPTTDRVKTLQDFIREQGECQGFPFILVRINSDPDPAFQNLFKSITEAAELYAAYKVSLATQPVEINPQPYHVGTNSAGVVTQPDNTVESCKKSDNEMLIYSQGIEAGRSGREKEVVGVIEARIAELRTYIPFDNPEEDELQRLIKQITEKV